MVVVVAGFLSDNCFLALNCLLAVGVLSHGRTLFLLEHGSDSQTGKFSEEIKRTLVAKTIKCS